VARNPLSNIRLLILDVDGVMTDGIIGVDERGGRIKFFCVADGSAIKYLLRAGLDCAVITAHDFPGIEQILKELGIKTAFKNAKKKLVPYQTILEEKNLKDDQVCYIGDDLVDIPILRRVALPVTVPDAPPEVKEFARYITKNRGGRGAIREVVEMILKAQDKWNSIMKRYLEPM